MRRGQWIGVLLAALLGSAGVIAPCAEARDDWQLWLEQKWSVKLSPSVKLIGKTEERYRQDMSDYYTQIASVGVSWKPARWLKVEPGYHYQWTEQPGRDTNENRVFLNLTPAWSWGRVELEDRHRLEFRHVNGRDDWRYRNRLKAGLELGRGWYAVEPYVADELFYGARAGEWVRNRFSAGIEKPLTGRLTGEVYYLIESNKQGRDWNEFHVLGVVVNLAF
jgi:hypothetical protein